MKKNKIFYFISLLVMCSCINIEENQINTIITKYIDKYPISIKNYDYIVRFYKKDTDTIFEISQDRIDQNHPSDFLINFIDSTGHKSINIDYKFIKIGNTKINNKLVFIFDTTDSIGVSFYNNLIIKKEEHKIEKNNHLTYPILPKTRIYKFSKNNLIFIEETDTIKFHTLIH